MGHGGIESSHRRRISKLERAHLDHFFLMQLFLLLQFLCIKNGFALGNLLSLYLVSFLDIVYFLIHHFLGSFFRLFCLKVKHGKRDFIPILFRQICLDHFDLLSLGVFDFIQNTVKIVSLMTCVWHAYDSLRHLTVTLKSALLIDASTSFVQTHRRLRSECVWVYHGI